MEKKGQVFISFIGDLEHYPDSDILLVEKDADYVRVCHSLSERKGTDPDLNIWVRSKNHYVWLQNFNEQINCPSVFKEKTARLVLAEKWNVELPDWLTDDDILGQNLLKINVDSKEKTRFEYRFLTHILGNAFNTDSLDASHLIEIIKVLVSDEAKTAFDRYPKILPYCFETRTKKWSEKGSEKWVKGICAKLPENANEVWRWLSLWSGLNRYPEKLLEYVLPPNQVILVRMIPPNAIHELPFEATAKEQMLAQIEQLFKDIEGKVSSSGEFQKVVECTSGRLLREFQLICGIIKTNKFAPTEDDIVKIQLKFRSCSGVTKNQLNALKYLVKPKCPTLLGPKEEWNSEEWTRWVSKEYIPFRAWQLRNRFYDEELEQTAAHFSDWYIREYAAIHMDPKLSITHCLRDLSTRNPEDEFTIILLIDCLPIYFMELLDEALRNFGFNRHDLHYRFAMLPTITGYNKTAILSGEWPDKTGNYEVILKKRALSDWNGKNVFYLNNLKTMLDMKIPRGTTIAILNYVDGDELLHSDVENKGAIYEEELGRLYARLAESVNEFSQKWGGAKENFNVLIVTDHGACRILEEEKRGFEAAVINKLFPNEKYRFAEVPDGQVYTIPANLWSLGYKFKRPFNPDDMTYFLPRGHNTVRHADNVLSYMHGGVTPEEVIVPIARYKLVKVAWKKLSFRFQNLDLVKETNRAKFYIQRMVNLEIIIQNQNSTDIRINRASVISPKADLKYFETIMIPSGSEGTFKIGCYFDKTALGEKSLEIEIIYEIANEQHTQIITLESDFKSALSGGFNLKDL